MPDRSFLYVSARLDCALSLTAIFAVNFIPGDTITEVAHIVCG